jgi:hypothetical protein
MVFLPSAISAAVGTRLRCLQIGPKDLHATPKQLSKELVFMLPCAFASLRGALLFSFFYFNTGTYKLVDLIWNKQVTLAELPIYVVAWVSIPNESYDFEKKLAVCPESGVACFQERKRRAPHSLIFRAQHAIHV